MRKINIEITVEEYDNEDQLNKDDRELVEESKKASQFAYAPYSDFKVGAAVRLGSGIILTGNNRENAAFPSGSCAENTVISYSGASHPDDPVTVLAISARSGGYFTSLPVSPCGNCRQIIAEEEDRTGKEIRMILYGTEKITIVNGISSLLPLRFNKNVLGK